MYTIYTSMSLYNLSVKRAIKNLPYKQVVLEDLNLTYMFSN